jgi:hypothetical protein
MNSIAIEAIYAAMRIPLPYHNTASEVTKLPHKFPVQRKFPERLCNQFDDTTSLSNLSLCLLAEPSCAHNQWDFWDTALSENLRVAEW